LKYLEICGWRLVAGNWLFVPGFYLEDQNGDRKPEKEERRLENGNINILLFLAV